MKTLIDAANRALALISGLSPHHIPSTAQMREAREVCRILMEALGAAGSAERARAPASSEAIASAMTIATKTMLQRLHEWEASRELSDWVPVPVKHDR